MLELTISGAQAGPGPQQATTFILTTCLVSEGSDVPSLHLTVLTLVTGQLVNKSPFPLRVPTEIVPRPGH